jgi:hypothetical protein
MALQLPRLHRPLRKRAKSPCIRRNTNRLRKPPPIALFSFGVELRCSTERRGVISDAAAKHIR